MRRLVYRGALSFPHGFHSGEGRRLAASDQPLLREPDGSVALAGTSLAGALRADLYRLLRACGGRDEQCGGQPDCRCLVCRLMGPRAPSTPPPDGEEGALRASRLLVVGGRSEGRPDVRVRDRVGIDRKTRTAADRRKYDLEVAEGPLELPFLLRLDNPEEDEKRYLEAVLRRLAAGWLALGGKSGSGLGWAELVRLDRTVIDLSDRESLVAHLLGEDPTAGGEPEPLVGPGAPPWAQAWELEAAVAPGEPAPGEEDGEADASWRRQPWAQLRLTLELDFPWGFLVHEPAEALARGFDHAYGRRADGSPRLPGSALRGALRGRAEQILRTLAGKRAACDLHSQGKACHEQIEEKNRIRRAAGQPVLSFQQELEVLCPACRVFGSGRLVSAVKLTEFHPVEGRRGQCRGQEQVAIDRFTGGAAAGLKFNSEAADAVTFAGDLYLEIGPSRLETWGLGLVALALRDLLWADLPLGFGTARGFNEYRARITGVDRFWIEPPVALAGSAPGPSLDAGTQPLRLPPDRPLDSPDAVEAAAGPELAARFVSWVEALHGFLAERRDCAQDRQAERVEEEEQ